MPEPAAFAAEVDAAVLRYRLRFGGRRYRGRSGDRLGSAPGSSLEFLDFRDYVPGDDLRLVDWNGYARTDQLRVRQQREEVSPFVDVVVDDSASMASTSGKERAARALVAGLVGWARRDGALPRVLRLGGDVVEPAALTFAGAPLPRLPQVPLRMASVRVLVSDGLWPVEPRPLLRGLAANAAWLVCLQLLDPWELAPTPGAALTLHDVETGQRLDVRLDQVRLDAYHSRLQRLVEDLRATVATVGGTHVRVTADALAGMCARDLLPAALVESA
ncbi:MAG: DUF58 domain-containing protein [Planctomycetes bacterium]|nr:DUF58 domain-containing protein [Planctomycetota bacterium]